MNKTNQKPQTNNSRNALISLLILVFVVLAFLNFQALKDFFTSLTFQPTEKLLAVETSLNLTDHGKTIFRATTPSLDSRDEFNESCEVAGSEISVLGCYVDGKIHVFDIEVSEFSGIVESTSAHELLHAVWARMSESERSEFLPVLQSVYEESSDSFKKSLAAYDEASKTEEIYVRSATQLKSLPDSLESHFATIFKDQDSVVDFYNSYITPFSELEENLDQLSSDISSLKEKIDKETSEYTSRAESFSATVAEFNSCASTPNCFTNETFKKRRAELINEKASLDSLYDIIDTDISAYNEKVDTYNEKVLYGKHLQSLINSNSSPTSL